MNLIELKTTLENLTKAKITQEQIGNALGITRSTVNTRMKNKSQLKLDEIPKIEKYFGVTLKHLQDADKHFELCKQVIEGIDCPADERQMVLDILISRPLRKIVWLFLRSLDGDEEAISVIKSMLENQNLAKVFLEQE